MNKFKTLFTISLITLIGVGVTAFYNVFDNPFKSLASGINEDGKNRTFVLDSSLFVNDGVATANYGNLAVYAKNCSDSNGVIKLEEGGELVIYCPTGGYNSNNFYHGFNNSNVSNISVVFNNANKTGGVILRWSRIDDNKTIEWRSTAKASSQDVASEDNLSFSPNSEGTFISDQGSHRSTYSCISVCLNGYNPVDIISVTISFICT